MGGVVDDFWLQGVHMIHCSYNSLCMGQIIQPDWDMFQSDHVCEKYHAGSRSICGGPVYLSDSLGCHDFYLIKMFTLMAPSQNAKAMPFQPETAFLLTLCLTTSLFSRYVISISMEV